MFTTPFDSYAITGDSITCESEGFTINARIEHDDTIDSPPERDDGFWPSLDPKEAGYIGENPEISFNEQMKHAQSVLEAWKNNEWFYCGIVLSVSKNGVMLDRHAASLWGIDCNYPASDNSCLLEVANDLLSDAIKAGKTILAKLI